MLKNTILDKFLVNICFMVIYYLMQKTILSYFEPHDHELAKLIWLMIIHTLCMLVILLYYAFFGFFLMIILVIIFPCFWFFFLVWWIKPCGSVFSCFFTPQVLRRVEEGIIGLKLGLNLPILDLIPKFNTCLNHIMLHESTC